MPSRSLSAPALLGGLGLLVDGPVRWGQPVRSRLPGIFVVEAPAAELLAPLDITAIRAWLERVPSLRLDGERPEPGALADRLRSFWLPGQPVLYIGRSAKGLGGRVSALYQTPLGDRRPHSGGHWLRTLQGLDALRIWWAETDAGEEYEDAAMSALAETVTDEERGRLRGGPVLPWANLEGTSGERRPTGITGAFRDPDEPGAGTAPGPRRPGAPAGTPSVPGRAVASTGGTRRTAPASTSARAGRSTAATSTRPRVTKAAPVAKAPPAPTHVTAAGLVALERELDELVNLRRPEVIARVKHARELGDLRENADYEAARNEQSFLEGRVRALEQLIKTAQVIDTDHTGEVMLGSTVVAEVEGEPATLHIVGSTEADPANGRISNASPVGKALLGHRAGDEIVIQTPGHELHYRIVEVRQLDR